MEHEFPISSYLDLAQELKTEKDLIEKEKADWQVIRAALTQKNTHLLDKQFKTSFGHLFQAVQSGSASALEKCNDELAGLLKQGASATLMSTHELSDYNVAMFIKDIHLVHGKEQLDIAANIVRITVIAGAALDHQKAYVGNGGINSLEQVCEYLAKGLKEYDPRLTMEQYSFCYRIFPWIAHPQPTGLVGHGEYNQPYHLFMRVLYKSPEIEHLQEKTLLRIMSLGWTPFSIVDEWLDLRIFVNVAAINFRWLTFILPYEDEVLIPYLDIVRARINPAIINALLNAFTSDGKIRKQIRAFFFLRPHWLLKMIISATPEKIFDLVRRNEQHLLVPFLKYYKQDLIGLRNKDNQDMLQYAIQCRSTVDNTIQVLRQSGWHV